LEEVNIPSDVDSDREVQIVAENISCSCSSDQEHSTLRGINLEAGASQMVAIAGAVGCGKVILKLYTYSHCT
jgi:ABC-type bacteriocin/lantibiotic exporter with double-glycine peptidase domain